MPTWRKQACRFFVVVAVSFIAAQLIIFFSSNNIDDFTDSKQESNDGHVLDKKVKDIHDKVEDSHDKAEIANRSDLFRQLDSFQHPDGEVQHGYDFEVERIVRDLKNPREHAITEKLPIILWWTPFTGDMGSVKKCNEGDCFFTQDRSIFHHDLTQVLLFYGTSFNETDLPLPRKGNHEWAVLHEESPKNYAYFYHEDFITLFNHTCTFRQGSDYSIATQYLTSLEELQRTPVLNFKEKDKLPLASTMFLQSGCNPPSDRDAYVNELMKFLEIDSYGLCLKNKELPEHLRSPLTMHDDSLRDFVGKYKFALTFENALCDDYLTEKLWRPLAAGTVPIYKGASNAVEWLPDNHSAILVDNFQSPKDLANYLTHLANNETEYNKYLSFKSNGVTNKKLLERMKTRKWGINDFYKMSFITGFECFICDRIHRNKKLMREGKDPTIHIANSSHYGCPRPVTYAFESPPNTEDWERETWQYEYDDALEKARKLRDHVLKNSSDVIHH